MVFSSLTFLGFFLPVALAAHWLAPRALRNAVLLLASLVFYTVGGGRMVLLLIVTSIIDYVAALVIDGGRAGTDVARRRARFAVTASVVGNLAMLGYFKYANFFVDQVNGALTLAGSEALAWTPIALPIGISFFTFQRMSYVIDVARGEREATRDPIRFLLFVALFPQLIAGPIVRYADIDDQLRRRDVRLEQLGVGGARFAHGLAKKVLVADTVAVLADAVFALPADELTTTGAWIGAIAYSIQIYFDFSGYSDMAIGLGTMFGFDFPENFARPYSAVSVTDFWRRWHVTLSTWFRDYVYIPLGGSRDGAATYRNLWIVFALTGLWHGAAWTFIVWGLYHGLLLVLERRFDLRAFEASGATALARRTVTLVLVIVGWVFFRADGMGQAVDVVTAMFTPAGAALPASVAALLDNRTALVLVASCTVALLPGDLVVGRWITEAGEATRPRLRLAFVTLVLPLAMVVAASSTFSPFLYFRF
ncbi:MAG: MBOAT family O-acyltransferase [Actinomycetes bacterium]